METFPFRSRDSDHAEKTRCHNRGPASARAKASELIQAYLPGRRDRCAHPLPRFSVEVTVGVWKTLRWRKCWAAQCCPQSSIECLLRTRFGRRSEDLSAGCSFYYRTRARTRSQGLGFASPSHRVADLGPLSSCKAYVSVVLYFFVVFEFEKRLS